MHSIPLYLVYPGCRAIELRRLSVTPLGIMRANHFLEIGFKAWRHDGYELMKRRLYNDTTGEQPLQFTEGGFIAGLWRKDIRFNPDQCTVEIPTDVGTIILGLGQEHGSMPAVVINKMCGFDFSNRTVKGVFKKTNNEELRFIRPKRDTDLNEIPYYISSCVTQDGLMRLYEEYLTNRK